MNLYDEDILEQCVSELHRKFPFIKDFEYKIYIIDVLKFCDSDLFRVFYTFSLGTFEVSEDTYQSDFSIYVSVDGSRLITIV
jgi:hypothetical protein